MDEMVLSPAEDIEEEQTRIDHVPWLMRKRGRVIKSWFSTVSLAMINPGRLIRAVPGESQVGEAWWFAVVTNALILFVGLGPILLIPIAIGISSGLGGALAALAGTLVGALIALLVIGMATVMFIGLWGMIAHAVLGATGTTSGGSAGTCQAICYASGANILTGLPCIGVYFGWVWWLVSAVFMVKEGQRVQGWRAALAVLTFPVTLLFLLVGLYAGFLYGVLWQAGPFAPRAAALSMESHAVLRAVLAYGDDHTGRGPDHAIQLVAGEYLESYELICSFSITQEEDVPLADSTVARFTGNSPAVQRRLVKACIEALPDGTIAHRLGDFVFTHHGLDLRKADAELWVIVLAPDPDLNGTWGIAGGVLAGRADGSVLSIPTRDWPDLVKEQNALRLKHGLPILPDPMTMTHGSPAVAKPRAP
jgi:hypothetical protein